MQLVYAFSKNIQALTHVICEIIFFQNCIVVETCNKQLIFIIGQHIMKRFLLCGAFINIHI